MINRPQFKISLSNYVYCLPDVIHLRDNIDNIIHPTGQQCCAIYFRHTFVDFYNHLRCIGKNASRKKHRYFLRVYILFNNGWKSIHVW